VEARDITGGIAEALAQQILKVAQGAETEQELLIGVEAALGPVLDQLGIPKQAQYEKTLLEGRADAVYGSVTIEYESPGKLATTPGRAESYRQARQYLREQAEIASPGKPEKALPALVGVVLDGFEIGFVIWRAGDGVELEGLSDLRLLRSQFTLEAEEGIAGRFHEIGPIPVSRDSITDLLRFLRALARRPLEATPLAEEFGPDAEMARNLVGTLYAALIESPTPRTEMLYREWLRVFGAVYGEPSAVKKTAVAALGEAYDIPDDDVGRMLFAVHTYFALIMKILAVELVALQAGAVIEPFIAGLSGIGDAEFDDRFRELETGRVFRARGIENFLEGDYLGWYVDEWTDDLRQAVRELSRRLSEFEPGTATLRPELTQDLLKELYHQLLPRQLRHDLGEFYTPDWLAECTLDRAGYEGEVGMRMLDPACGSGTFLVAAIKRLKQRGLDENRPPAEIASAVVGGVVGFDLNPLAVIAARTNYLLAAGDLIRAAVPFRIPVYICDSITASGNRQSSDFGLEGVLLATSVGDFAMPHRFAASESLPELLAALEFCIENGYPPGEFMTYSASLAEGAPAEDLEMLNRLYSQIVSLKKDGLDGIWPRLLSNTFAPLFASGGFDFVIGNPPWIGWEAVSPEYRELTKPLWEQYGLFTLSGGDARLGGGKKDMSMLMTMVAAEEYLKEKGTLTFLITQTVLQTTGAGDGFRRFRTDKRPLAVKSVDDLANFNPFDDASNWTAIIHIRRDEATSYPVPYRVWNRQPEVRFDRLSPKSKVLDLTYRTEFAARPVRDGKESSPWLIGTTSSLAGAKRMSGEADYAGKAGITVWLDGVFQVEVLETRSDGLIRIRNHADVGKTSLEMVEWAVEPDLLFPFTPWKEFGRWTHQSDRYLLVPQDPATRFPYPLDTMRSRWPNTFAYLKHFEDQLRTRSGYSRYFKPQDPWYAIYNVSPQTMAEWKVTWRTMGSAMQASVVGPMPGPEGLPKPSVFKNTVIFVPADSPEEATYLAALLNSRWANYLLRASNVRGGKSAFATNVLHALRIAVFDRDDDLHMRLSDLGRLAVEQAEDSSEELDHTEYLVDEAAGQYWNLSERAREGMREVLEVIR
jgi:hypothetical protein